MLEKQYHETAMGMFKSYHRYLKVRSEKKKNGWKDFRFVIRSVNVTNNKVTSWLWYSQSLDYKVVINIFVYTSRIYVCWVKL